MNWANEPFSKLLKDKIIPSIEGRSIIYSTLIYCILAAVTYVYPSILGIDIQRITGTIMIFLIWPILLFTMYCFVAVNVNFRSSILSLIWVLCWACGPFWIIYG